MRLSRKAGLLACGVLWIKYACEYVPKGSYEPIHNNPEPTGGGFFVNKDSFPMRVCTQFGYWFDGQSQKYVYEQYNKKTYYWNDVVNGGFDYYIADGTETMYMHEVRPYDDTFAHATTYKRVIGTRITETDSCTIGDKIGFVRAAKYKYPDEKNGYSYVATQGQNIIMQDGDGNYYAYILASAVPSEIPLSATIENDVLEVRGEGTAEIIDNVLVVRGKSVATIANGILYVRC